MAQRHTSLQESIPDKYLEILAEAAGTCFSAIESQNVHSEMESAKGRQKMLTVIGETAHQLRSKLSSVLLQAEIVGAHLKKDNSDVKDLLQRIEDVGNVLETVKKRFAPVALKTEKLDLVPFVRHLLNKHLTADFARVLSSATFIAVFDPKLLEEAIEELIQNSRKAVHGKRKLQMTASIYGQSRNGKPWCVLEFQDNGDGIPKEYRNKPIKEFTSQWPNHERGTGLGLARVSNIVAEHGGVFQPVEATWGARFRMDFPRYGKQNIDEGKSNE